MTVRDLDIADLPACLALADDRGWSREEHKWRLLFRIGRVYGIDAPEGGMAAAVVATHYDGAGAGDVVAISMMLVARGHERRGLGRAVLSHAIAGARTAVLSATPQGRPLYERLGFRVTGRVDTYRGEVEPGAPTGATRPHGPADQAILSTMDEKAFGARRSALLAELPGFCADLRVTDGGFGGAWRTDTLRVLGPVTAADEPTARALLADLAAPGGALRLDALAHHPWLREWATERGLRPWFGTDLMTLGPDLPGDPAAMVTPVMLALG